MPKRETKLLLSIEDALKYGLILCSCGHPPNNHFDHGTKPCAFCDCASYEMTARRGQLVEV
jgi:hypothetical protein